MQIRGKGVSFSRVAEIVAKVSAERYDGNVIVHPDAHPLGGKVADYGFTGRLRCVSSYGPGARVSWSGRHSPATCWHAYRDALDEILTEYPNAVITTAMARYEGYSGFRRTYPATGRQNIGSMMQPAYMPDLCECPE